MITETAKIEIHLNDAAFLAQLLYKYMSDNNYETAYLRDLAKHLNGKAGC